MERLRVPAVRSALIDRGLLVASAVFLSVGGLALANGGYFPVSWGWSALGLLALALISLATNTACRPGLLGGKVRLPEPPRKLPDDLDCRLGGVDVGSDAHDQ